MNSGRTPFAYTSVVLPGSTLVDETCPPHSLIQRVLSPSICNIHHAYTHSPQQNAPTPPITPHSLSPHTVTVVAARTFRRSIVRVDRRPGSLLFVIIVVVRRRRRRRLFVELFVRRFPDGRRLNTDVTVLTCVRLTD